MPPTVSSVSAIATPTAPVAIASHRSTAARSCLASPITSRTKASAPTFSCGLVGSSSSCGVGRRRDTATMKPSAAASQPRSAAKPRPCTTAGSSAKSAKIPAATSAAATALAIV